ncbi:MAG TPA: PLP-dependent aminotransferase family protein [Solirubrobacteraceae bacterium]|nr:PLP-dependent aminotransferase family protein [Solirubrobacteraceae bacterium]
MDLHIVLDRNHPLRAQVERELRDGIRLGRLRGGSRLPPTRLLARELGVSRGVVVEAYAQLVAEGYLLARTREGTRVAEGLAQDPRPARPDQTPQPRVRYDLRAGIPDLSLFPRRAWHTATARALRELPDAALSYGPPAGMRRLREAVGAYLGRVRAVLADPDQILITCGSSDALGLLWRTFREHGAQRIAIEDPSWPRIAETIRQAGMTPVPIPVDEHGLVVSALAASQADAAVVSPAHQYPTGAVMHPSRRAELIAWARRSGGLIVEDDYDAEYRYDGPPIASLQSMAPDRVAYIGTCSKTLAPGMRLGWLIVPDRLASEQVEQHAITYAQPSALTQAGFVILLERGDLDRHLRRTRRIYRARRATLVAALAQAMPAWQVRGASAGLHVMAWLPPGSDEAGIVAAARARGLLVDGLHRECAVHAASPPGLVLGYGAIAEPAIGAAIRDLAEVSQLPYL